MFVEIEGEVILTALEAVVHYNNSLRSFAKIPLRLEAA